MLTENQIKFLNRICPDKWTEENNVINVSDNVIISNINLTEIPVQFGKINGNFNCNDNQLTMLDRAPYVVTETFWCGYNQLITLEGGPHEVSIRYFCSHNNLTNLIGASEICTVDFYCDSNQLTSLEGCPKLIIGDLTCRDNPHLEYLWGIGRVEGEVYYDNRNEINEWIIECMRKDIIFPHLTLEENINWIKQELNYSSLLRAPREIRQHFSDHILHIIDNNIY